MRSFLFLLFCVFAFFTAHAQTNSETTPNNSYSIITDSTVLIFCEVMPTFKTKEYKSFEQYLMNHLIYPKDASTMGISGYIFVKFIIEIDGSVSNVQIVKGRELYPSCDQEAIRVIANSPKWNPGMQNGKAIRVKKTSRIYFNSTN